MKKRKSTAYDAVVSDTLKNLVRQFSQELCFYRELIQNAIDAGSGRIEVECEYLDDRGVAVSRVIDFGEGMDRSVIDSQLTRLFSSTKEDDFTKIGKFGIGFVSVFAVGPEVVVVDTGRGGEHWRVLFRPDGNFERIRLDDPVEGTRVEVYVRMKREAFPDFRTRSRETVQYWCRHTEAEIVFDGERVNEDFDLDSPVKVRREQHGTLIVAALSTAEKPFFGFYNQGITLLEGRKAWFPGVTFKIKSRYLEHTLTRDNVKQDAQFDKAMGILKDVIHRDLPRELFARLAERPDDALWQLGTAMVKNHWAGAGRAAAVIPRIDGPPMTLSQAREAAAAAAGVLKGLGWSETSLPLPRQTSASAVLKGTQVLLADDAATPVPAALQALGVPVVAIDRAGALARELEQQGIRVLRASDVLAAPRPLPAEAAPPSLVHLAADATALLASAGVEFLGTSFASFEYEGSSVAALPFLLQPRAGPLGLAVHRPALGEDALPAAWPLRLLGRRHLVLNVGHPLVNRLAAMHETQAAAASYMLAKVICLADGLHPDMEDRLLRRTVGA